MSRITVYGRVEMEAFAIERRAMLAINVGVSLLESGAEVKRAKESARRIALALGAERCEVLALGSFMILTFFSQDGQSCTKAKRVNDGGADFYKFERLNALSRKICTGRLCFCEAETEFKAVNVRTEVSTARLYLLSMAVAFCFALFFGGGIAEAFSSAICALTVQFLSLRGGGKPENRLISVCVTSLVAGAACLIAVKLGPATNYDAVAIGNIMLLVPGISFMSAARDFIGGETLSGMVRFAEAVLTALAIAVGFALPSLLI